MQRSPFSFSDSREWKSGIKNQPGNPRGYKRNLRPILSYSHISKAAG